MAGLAKVKTLDSREYNAFPYDMRELVHSEKEEKSPVVKTKIVKRYWGNRFSELLRRAHA